MMDVLYWHHHAVAKLFLSSLSKCMELISAEYQAGFGHRKP